MREEERKRVEGGKEVEAVASLFIFSSFTLVFIATVAVGLSVEVMPWLTGWLKGLDYSLSG